MALGTADVTTQPARDGHRDTAAAEAAVVEAKRATWQQLDRVYAVYREMCASVKSGADIDSSALLEKLTLSVELAEQQHRIARGASVNDNAEASV